MSKGENKISQLLNQSFISFTKEKTFSDLKHGKFRFDFYLPNAFGGPAIIEFNGEQHYKYTPHFYKNQLDFRQAQGRDMRKITYCLAHNIPLYIIPFWEIDKITTARQLFQQKYLATSRWKNFEDYEAYKKSSLFTKKPLK